jgi:hypothetical protein
MIDQWDYVKSNDFITIEVDSESVKYNPETGEVVYLTSYKNGVPASRAYVYRTGRGVVKMKVDGASHRLMDLIYEKIHGVSLKGFQCYPKNGKFSDLRADNIIMVRTREAMFE